MTRQGYTWVPALTLLALLGAAASSDAQELRPDVTSNGTLIGAGTGAAAGVVLALATEEICSPGACAYLGAIAGGMVGHLIDRKMEHPPPVVPGSFVDDRLGNGALFGALGGVGIALVDAAFRCKPGPDRGPCTRQGVLVSVLRAAEWTALVGLLIDAAIPSKFEVSGPQGARSQHRRVAIRFDMRF